MINNDSATESIGLNHGKSAGIARLDVNGM